MNFYSAESEAEVVSPKPRKPKRQARKPAEGEATTTGKEAPRQKRPTLATVSASLESLMSAIPQLTSQIQHVAGRQEKFEVKMMETQLGPKSQLGEPLGAAFAPTTAGPSLGVIAKDLAPPPRTTAQPPLGLLGPLMNVEKPKTVQELEEEKGGRELPDQSNLARAVLAQSHALTTLVSQIAAAGQDPMTDLSTPGAGTSTRGAQACTRGTFFTSVLQAMSRRMAPTSSCEMTPDQMMARGICGARYLERFGGYGRLREWGMTALDFLMEGNIPAAKDTITLLAVTIEQGVLDHGKLEIASLLCLQEDVPAGVFMTRQARASSTVRLPLWQTRIKWITCALAYMKEMDVITSKRLEYVQAPKPSIPGPDEPGPNKQPKGAPKKKGGKGQTKGEEEENYACSAPDGQMNPLEQEIEFTTWGMCLSRWILNSGTSLAWHLRKSFTAEWRGSSSSTATYSRVFNSF